MSGDRQEQQTRQAAASQRSATPETPSSEVGPQDTRSVPWDANRHMSLPASVVLSSAGSGRSAWPSASENARQGSRPRVPYRLPPFTRVPGTICTRNRTVGHGSGSWTATARDSCLPGLAGFTESATLRWHSAAVTRPTDRLLAVPCAAVTRPTDPPRRGPDRWVFRQFRPQKYAKPPRREPTWPTRPQEPS